MASATSAPPVAVDVDDRHRGTLPGQGPRRGPTDPAGATGHDGDSVLEASHVRPPQSDSSAQRASG